MVDDYTDTYNWDRPHDNLGLQTPQEFLQARGVQVRASQSHML
jgi:transposase InsO family protein